MLRKESMDISFQENVPLYGKTEGSYGFIDGGQTSPLREVSTSKLFIKDRAVCVIEKETERFLKYHPGGTDYDLGGMILRVELPAGAYDFEIVCVGGPETMLVAIDGMNPERIAAGGYWDAGELVLVRNHAMWRETGDKQENIWNYSYVNAGRYVDIFLEPLHPDTVIGIRRVRIRKHTENEEKRNEPCIFILGDSTAKSYVFEEAPMSGWGQLFYRMVDENKAAVVNYSNGGRSLRIMYHEGRFNDLLLAGQKGDYVLLQSGHNDERARNDGTDPDGEKIRYGRGSTEEMYYNLLTQRFLPAIRSRGMIPVLVTPVTRINAECRDETVFADSFSNRKFPVMMRRAAKDTDTLLLDLNQKSVEHFNRIGAPAAKAMVMSLEPGETPGKTNGGSYANGNPGNHADGTHYKECLSKQYCRMAAEELVRTAGEGNQTASELCGLLREEVLRAAKSGDFSEIFPEICRDTIAGRGAYYRNQIEKMVQIGIFQKDQDGNFHPLKPCNRNDFIRGIQKIWQLPEGFTGNGRETGEKEELRKQDAAEILYDAYLIKFGMEEEKKPPYMTDYNGRNIDPHDPNYDDNLPEGETIYYPLVPFERVEDVSDLTSELYRKTEAVYRLGIMRCEEGIRRGFLKNGVLFQPRQVVTREKAAKYLYFCFVLGQNIKKENHLI